MLNEYEVSVLQEVENKPVGTEVSYDNQNGKWIKTTKSYYHQGGVLNLHL